MAPTPPGPPRDTLEQWVDPVRRQTDGEHRLSRLRFLGEAFPYFDTQVGPGSLGVFLGAQPHFAPDTVWYEPCIADPESYGHLRFQRAGNKWLDAHLAIIDEGIRHARGRYLVGMPDLIENIDTLAAMRGNEALLYDLMDRPAWVHRCLDEINAAFFEAFDLIFARIRDADGGNAYAAFNIWGPGKTAKVQCDFCCMISSQAFGELVVPRLKSQCEWLDYSMFHLDGENAIKHLDALLAIEALDAIEFTPQRVPADGGSPRWYELYKRIKAGGKAVQAIGVAVDEVIPLLDAVGPEGIFLTVWSESIEAADKLLDAVAPYRS